MVHEQIRGHWRKASSALREASELETASLKIVLPDSTTVFFLPSSAWEGVLRSAIQGQASL